ncbi:hypothetical protein D9757_013203 [Collybiopsis confluens]|uniref:HAT C-terminal dimerisation domain-containing protein n=1 Tax=Collybiopsis confluens TaxID=2823264 RepID=A0A8H5G1N0_9AGAR|nr:hypothetical protein D9757_013203 [Collybiopsis confluens]
MIPYIFFQTIPADTHAHTEDNDVAQQEGDEDNDEHEEAEDKDEAEESDTEAPEINSEEARYWELARKSGFKAFSRIQNKATKDLRLVSTKTTRFVDGTETPGYYCNFCLEAKSKKDSFFTGNVTSHRNHITRNHYEKYLEVCEDANVGPKAKPPTGKKALISGQASITDFTAKQKPQTPFSKSGLAEFIMEYIIDSDVWIATPFVGFFFIYVRAFAKGITSRISLVFDGWSRRRRKSYNSLVIFWIHSPPDKPTEWTLRNMLVAFDRMKGRHTGSGVGKLLVEEIRRYGFEERLGWTTSDNVTVNDATVRYICKEFDPYSISLNPKERRGRCMEHTLHLAAHHFAQALQIPSIMKTNQDLRQLSKLFDELDLDIDDSGCIEADDDDADAIIDANCTDFEAGDAVGKIFAFIAQVRASDHATLFLSELCQKNDCPALELLTWVRTRWGSLYHCFKRLIQIRQAYDIFCCLADNNSDVPALDGGKKYAFYQMSNNEWNVVISTCTTELGQEKVATCHKVFPILEHARSLQAGLHNMQKWYQSAVDSPIYFICHVRKLSYLNAVWKPEWVRKSRSAMEQEFLRYWDVVSSQYHQNAEPMVPLTMPVPVDLASASDDWMDTVLAAKEITSDIDATADPLKELDDYLDSKLIPRAACEDIITWWGHNQFAYPVLSRLARDYLAIQGSAAAAERSFSSGGITDTARRGCLGDELFGEMQLLKNAYQDGRISAQQETWLHVDASFD